MAYVNESKFAISRDLRKVYIDHKVISSLSGGLNKVDNQFKRLILNHVFD